MNIPAFTVADLRALARCAIARSGKSATEVIGTCPSGLDIESPRHDPPNDDDRLNLREPGTAMALVVLLAFALGIDPGPGGRAVAWRPVYASGPVGLRRVGWWLSGDNEAVYYVAASDALGDEDEIVSDAIATEKDDLAALVAACKLVVEPQR